MHGATIKIVADCPGNIMKSEFYAHPSLIIFHTVSYYFDCWYFYFQILYNMSVVSGDWDDKILLLTSNLGGYTYYVVSTSITADLCLATPCICYAD